MSFKPGDFFLGVVNFLGVLVPGAVVLLLHGELVMKGVSAPSTSIQWLAFGLGAYIIGQLLLAISEVLNYAAGPVGKIITPQVHRNMEAYRDSVRLDVPPKVGKDKNAVLFHAALSYVRLNHDEAAAEIDRHMADYKLLRNLVFVCFIDLVLSLATVGYSWRPLMDLLLAAAIFGAFVRVHHWALLLAFQYACLIGEPRGAAVPPATLAASVSSDRTEGQGKPSRSSRRD